MSLALRLGEGVPFVVTSATSLGLGLGAINRWSGVSRARKRKHISLTSSIIIVFTKIMATPLKEYMDGLIDNTQTAFLSGRCTLNSYMVVNEIIHLCKRRKESPLVVKLDMAKGFDRVSWSFLVDLLRWQGFPDAWVWWITAILNSSESIGHSIK
ncbi:hypothetical protein Cni_G08586 [Canna indica]|uniref:Reverse transcriptase domain-containing protein n=1 Tax=Canna indica TaxID=4628 RepID=A0AAQ3K0N9_9LILI|nr:hypothetical protein Cni_G08586 [Canna indica]